MKIRISIWLKVLLTAILLVLLVRTFAFTSCSIPSTGMENSLYQGETLIPRLLPPQSILTTERFCHRKQTATF